MHIKAHSKNEALKIAQERYGHSAENIRLILIKEPYKAMWGIFKRKGKYEAEITISSKRTASDIKKLNEKDGSVQIEDGILNVINPVDDGRYPFIIADDPHIDVYVNGEKAQGVFVITEDDAVEFKPVCKKPKTKIFVEISEDKMEAKLNLLKIRGKKFSIMDTERGISAKVSSKYEKVEPQDVSIEECIDTLVDLGIKPELIDISEIIKLIGLKSGGCSIVAHGIPPKIGKRTEIRYYFDVIGEEENNYLNSMNEGILIEPLVQIGDVLAIKQDLAIKGEDGLNVKGELVKADEIEDITLCVGKGAILMEEGMKAVASTSGRPFLENGVVSVIPLMVISNDINKDTGDIRFDGDIIIKGNIMDNMKIKAGGRIEIYGSVYNSEVCSRKSINILGKVIGSKISAGVCIIDYFCIVPQIKIVVLTLKKLLALPVTNEDFDILKFEENLKKEKPIFKKCVKEIKKILYGVEDGGNDEINILLKQIEILLLRIRSLSIDDVSRITKLNEDFEDYIESISIRYDDVADISLDYAQNSTIQACGSIVIEGEGSYLSGLIAKDRIIYNKYSSNVKGGFLIAGKGIKAGTIGTVTGMRTYCKVLDKRGKVDAFYYDGTIINIDNKIKVIKAEGGHKIM